MNKKVVLVILDGWGHGPQKSCNAVYSARTPFVSSLYTLYPNAELLTSGENVGLPEGQMGNSEVGHLNLGAGRVVYQELGKINKSIRDHELDKNPVLLNATDFAKSNNKKVHLLGLVSDGGVHSHIDHLTGLVGILEKEGLKDIFIHAITDGRDTDPRSGRGFIESLLGKISNGPAKLASICGRYYAMDRDKRWERVKLAYDLYVHGKGIPSHNALDAISKSYNEGITDEFIQPVVMINKAEQPVALMEPDDVVICFNFRTDRCREITSVLTQQAFPDFEMKPVDLYYVTMTNYDDTFCNVEVIFEKEDLKNTLGEVISNHGRSQVRIAETEKYPHVTFFFSGGREEPFEGEKRIMIASPKVATYDLKPEMSALEVTEAVVNELRSGKPDFMCLNFANPDMVGHTGVFEAVVKAVETVDSCLKQVVEAGVANGYSFIITADHGNADYCVNEDGSPNTAHTTNPVPVFLIDKDHKEKLKNGILADIAPTVLKLMNLEQPAEMTGKPLI